MASSFDGRLDPGMEGMRVVGHHQETAKPNPLISSSNTPPLPLATPANQISRRNRYSRWIPSCRIRNLLCFSTAEEYPATLSTNNNPLFQIAKPLFPNPRQLLPQITIQDIAVIPTEQLSRSEETALRTEKDAYDNRHQRRNEKILEDTILLNDNGMKHTRNTGGRAETSDLPLLHPSQILLAIESDRRSTSSGDSEDRNEYNAMGKVQGVEGAVNIELLTSFDTQSLDNVIFSPALDGLVNCSKHDVPEQRIKTIKSPLDPQKYIELKKFVRLQLYFYQIGVTVEVDLKIVEVAEEPNGFQVVLGRTFLRNYQLENGRNLLLERVVVANAKGPKISSHPFGPLRFGKRSKEQKKADEAEIKAIEEAQRQAHAILYPKVPKEDSSKQTHGISSSNGSRVGNRGIHRSAEFPANLPSGGVVYNPNRMGQPAVQQPLRQSAAPLPNAIGRYIQRTDTASSRSTQSTIFSNYSFGRVDTWGSGSSISSWSGISACTPKEGGPASQSGNSARKHS